MAKVDCVVATPDRDPSGRNKVSASRLLKSSSRWNLYKIEINLKYFGFHTSVGQLWILEEDGGQHPFSRWTWKCKWVKYWSFWLLALMCKLWPSKYGDGLVPVVVVLPLKWVGHHYLEERRFRISGSVKKTFEFTSPDFDGRPCLPPKKNASGPSPS